MKAAIVVLSDPKPGSEESLGRVFNALAAAYDFKQQGDEVSILFQAAGSRWPGELDKADHPAHGLHEAVKDNVAAVSCGCPDVFGVPAQLAKTGHDSLTDTPLPATSALPTLPPPPRD